MFAKATGGHCEWATKGEYLRRIVLLEDFFRITNWGSYLPTHFPLHLVYPVLFLPHDVGCLPSMMCPRVSTRELQKVRHGKRLKSQFFGGFFLLQRFFFLGRKILSSFFSMPHPLFLHFPLSLRAICCCLVVQTHSFLHRKLNRSFLISRSGQDDRSFLHQEKTKRSFLLC
jgi:hypothetical protein